MSFRLALLITAAATAPAFAQAPRALPEVVVTGQRAEASAIALDADAVTASRLGVPVRDLPASVSVIDASLMLARGHATTLEAITGTVGMTGGVTLGATPRFSSRGFTANNIALMRDGVRQNTLAQSARTLDPFVLGRIEVLKGPASVLHGEGAIAGAVNYVSKSPPTAPEFVALASVGSWQSWRLGLGGGAPLSDAVSVRLDGVMSGSDGYVEASGGLRYALSGALRWDIADDWRLDLGVDWSRDDLDSYFGTPLIHDGVRLPNGTIAQRTPALAAGETLVNPRIDPRTRRINYNITNGYSESEYVWSRAALTWSPSQALELTLAPYRATQEQDYVNSEGFVWNPATGLVQRDALGFIGRDDVLTGVRAQARLMQTLAGRPIRLVLGADLSENDQVRGTRPLALTAGAVTPAPLALTARPGPFLLPATGQLPRPEPFARAVVETRAVYAEALFEPTDALKLVAGVRFDDIALERTAIAPTIAPAYAKDYDPVTGRLGVVWSAAPGLNLYAAWTTAAEPVVQLVSQTATSRDFGLQTGRQYEVGAKWSFLDGRADATFALFDIRKEDILTSTVVNGVRIQQQIGAQVSQGAELALALQPAAGWTIDANAAFVDAAFEDFNENLGTGIVSRSGNRPDNVPEWAGNLFISKDWSNGLGVQAGLRHVGDRFANSANTLPLEGYTLLEAAAYATLGPARITLRGRNLTDETYADWAVFANTPFLKLGDPRSAELSVSFRR